MPRGNTPIERLFASRYCPPTAVVVTPIEADAEFPCVSVMVREHEPAATGVTVNVPGCAAEATDTMPLHVALPTVNAPEYPASLAEKFCAFAAPAATNDKVFGVSEIVPGLGATHAGGVPKSPDGHGVAVGVGVGVAMEVGAGVAVGVGVAGVVPLDDNPLQPPPPQFANKTAEIIRAL